MTTEPTGGKRCRHVWTFDHIESIRFSRPVDYVVFYKCKACGEDRVEKA